MTQQGLTRGKPCDVDLLACKEIGRGGGQRIAEIAFSKNRMGPIFDVAASSAAAAASHCCKKYDTCDL